MTSEDSAFIPVGVLAPCCCPPLLQQPTHLPFGSGVSASFHQAHITKRTAIHLLNPSGPLLDPCPDLRLRDSDLSCPAYAIFITYYLRGRTLRAFYVETGNGASLESASLSFM
jgi:hypothetical protein